MREQAVDVSIRDAPASEPTNLNYFVDKFLRIHGQQQAAKPWLLSADRSPADNVNRHLAGALLRDDGVEFGKPASQEPLPEKRMRHLLVHCQTAAPSW